MLAVIVGLVFVVLGFWGIVGWWPDFVIFIKGSIPAMMIFGGILAVIAGITSIRDSLEAKAAARKNIE